MASIISQVTDLDRIMRLKVKELETVKEKLPEFLREQKKTLSQKLESESRAQINARKREIENGIKGAKNSAKIDLEKALKELEKYNRDFKEKWIDEIYHQCVFDYLEE